MPYTLLEYFQKHGLKLVEASLQHVVGKATSYVTVDAQYRQTVIQPAWERVPLPIRAMMGRDYSRWDELFLRLREEVYDLGSDTVSLRPNATVRLLALLRQVYGSGTKGSSPPAARGGGLPPPGPMPSPPLASPVQGAAPGVAVPLAMPVHAPQAGTGKPADVVVGIDLGTSYSLIAYVDAQGRPSCIHNGTGDLLTPSVVLFEESSTVVGKEAVLASAMEPEKVAEGVKRDMGARVYRKKLNDEYLPPEVISSLILRSLKNDAERKLGPIRRAVITVPAYFEETRRRATIDAGRLAGLEVLDIINEPTAAAIAYGHSLGFLDRAGQRTEEKPLRVLVYDLGGGTFDVTIMEIKGQDFKALATDGDVCLGGRDWDEKLIDLAAERFRQQYREDPRDNPVSLQDLRLAAEGAKRTLTQRTKATLFVNHLGSRLKVEVSREEFEEATAALLERTRLTSELVARQAGLGWEEIDRVLLVGGSTRMPMVPRMLEQLTGKKPDCSLAVDEAVAHGAALYAQMLAPAQGEAAQPPGFSVTNVNSHSLGILASNPRTGQKTNKVLIPKNSPLPRTVTKVFRTFKPNQHKVVITVLEGESSRPEVCTRLGVCAIRNLPTPLPSGWPVQVSYTYAANGQLHVAARIKGSRAAVEADFERENSLPDEDLELWTQYINEELCHKC